MNLNDVEDKSNIENDITNKKIGPSDFIIHDSIGKGAFG